MNRVAAFIANLIVAVTVLVGGPVDAATLLPNGEQQFFDSSGQPLAAGKVYMYQPGTTITKQTWQDAAQFILNTNPITLDAGGRAIIYGSGVYRQIVQDSIGNVIWDQLTTDTSYQSPIWAGTSGGTANTQTVVTTSFAGNDGQAIWFRAGQSNTAAATLNPGGYGAVPILKDTASGPVALTGGEIVANNIVGLVYDVSLVSFHIVDGLSSSTNSNGWIIASAYGCLNDGTTDNTACWIGMTTACPVFGCVLYFPSGKWSFSSNLSMIMSPNQNVTLAGGGQEVTQLYFPNVTAGVTFQWANTGTNSVQTSDLSLVVNQAGSGIALNYINGTTCPSAFPTTAVSNVTIRGNNANTVWAKGIVFHRVSGTNVHGYTWHGSSGTGAGTGIGLTYEGDGSCTTIIHNQSNVQYTWGQYGVLVNDFTQGIAITNANFTNIVNGVILSCLSQGCDQLSISNSQFGTIGCSYCGDGMVLNGNLLHLMITTSLFYVKSGTTGMNLATGVGAATIIGNVVQGVPGANGIRVQNSLPGNVPVMIAGNVLENMTTGVFLDTGSTFVTVINNSYTGNVSNVTNSGTNNRVGAAATVAAEVP